MATIVPSDISRLALSGGNRRELETLQQLKTRCLDILQGVVVIR